MRTSRWIFVAILSLLFVLGPAGTAWAQSYDPEELQFLELINQYRQENGLEPLLLSTPLSVASERHSEDMGTYGFFSHTTEASSYYPVGADHTVRIAQEGYDYNTYTAENLAYGQASAEEVFEAWRTSPEHNVNMLGDYAVIGIGLVWTNGVPYWTTDFGAYVDPSASGGSSGNAPENTSTAAPGTTPSDQGPAPEQTMDNTTADNAPTADQSAGSTPGTQRSTTGGTRVEEQAAENQYAQKPARNLDAATSADKPAASFQYAKDTAPEENASQAEYADQTAPEDQYAQAPPDTTSVNQGEAAPGDGPPLASASTPQSAASEVSAPAPKPAARRSAVPADDEPDSGSNAAQVAAARTEATQADTSQDTPQANAAQTNGEPEPLSVLPDTGGLPLLLVFGGATLAGCALVVARRVFQD